MGYCSDVVLILSPKSIELIDDNTLQEFASPASVHSLKDGTVLYYWKDIYWHGNPIHEKVDALMTLLNSSDMDDEYKFMRLGEAIGDFEENGHYYADDCEVFVEQKLSVNFPTSSDYTDTTDNSDNSVLL